MFLSSRLYSSGHFEKYISNSQDFANAVEIICQRVKYAGIIAISSSL